MPRKPRICIPDYPVHLSARCNNRDWFSIPLEDVWEIYELFLWALHHRYGVKIHSFVLMANHIHMIASFPLGNMGLAMQYFMRETAKKINRRAGRLNHMYGNRYYPTSISSLHHFEHVYKYVYRNPVEANACIRVEEYRFSTLQVLLGVRRTLIPLEEDTVLFNDVEGTLAWLNFKTKNENRIAIAKALKAAVFTLPKNPENKRAHQLETSRY